LPDGELDFDHMKYSVGGGLTFRLDGKALLEFSWAWGGDEGSQTYVTGNTNNALGFGTRSAGTVGLRGVFYRSESVLRRFAARARYGGLAEGREPMP